MCCRTRTFTARPYNDGRGRAPDRSGSPTSPGCFLRGVTPWRSGSTPAPSAPGRQRAWPGLHDGAQVRAAGCANPDDDPVADLEARRIDDGRDAVRPVEEHRLVTRREGLPRALPDQQVQRAAVAALDVDRHLAGLARDERAAEQIERLARLRRVDTVVADDGGGRGGDLLERRSAICADIQGHRVTDVQPVDADLRRDSGRPAEEHRLGARREGLLLALAEQRAERRAVAVLDGDRHRGGRLAGELTGVAVEDLAVRGGPRTQRSQQRGSPARRQRRRRAWISSCSRSSWIAG